MKDSFGHLQMPPWNSNRTTDEIWKVILFEYWHTGIPSPDMGLILNLTNNLGEQVRLTMSKLRMNVKAAPVIGVALGALLLSATAVGLGQAADLPEGFAKGELAPAPRLT